NNKLVIYSAATGVKGEGRRSIGPVSPLRGGLPAQRVLGPPWTAVYYQHRRRLLEYIGHSSPETSELSSLPMLIPTTALAWAELTSGAAELGHRRRVHSAAQLALHPQQTFTQTFDGNERRGFYRLCAQTEATLTALQQPHRTHPLHAMAAPPLVLILHDT